MFLPKEEGSYPKEECSYPKKKVLTQRRRFLPKEEGSNPAVWRILDLLHIGPQVNYVHLQWIYIDPGWTYLGPSKIDYIWDI